MKELGESPGSGCQSWRGVSYVGCGMRCGGVEFCGMCGVGCVMRGVGYASEVWFGQCSVVWGVVWGVVQNNSCVV